LSAEYVKLKVPHGNYAVNKVNPVTGKLEIVDASVFCFSRKVESGDTVNDCEMQVQASITADSL
jgi:hypothetical protein